MGFKRVKKDEPYFLYYPLKENFVYKKGEERYFPQREDIGKILIFYDASCPFCVYFNDKLLSLVKEAAPGAPIRTIDMIEEEEEVKKRGTVSFCIVNTHPIKTSFFDKEKFKEEVRKAISSEPLVYP